MEKTFDWFGARGISLARTGSDREYAGKVDGIEGVELVLQLDDLPIEEPQLFDSQMFTELQEENENDFDSGDSKEQTDDSGNAKEKKTLIPQVYMLSGGDITPFSLRFQFVENNYTEAKLHYKVTGLYTTPLTIEGPLFDEK